MNRGQNHSPPTELCPAPVCRVPLTSRFCWKNRKCKIGKNQSRCCSRSKVSPVSAEVEAMSEIREIIRRLRETDQPPELAENRTDMTQRDAPSKKHEQINAPAQ